MPSFKNVSPQGDLDLPLVGRVITAGEVFEVTAAQADLLSAQPDVWQIVNSKKENGK
ncbi:hypothetical protein [Cryobacterium sp. Sr8]|uniref:hypothetical protein n=1 Tax=Cryobacterium sp. Sr8 TaxID=1259203 RepID=UPI00141ABFB5|nr:hypothetical protein [Cryobacterium sp. Sr8]